MDINNDNLLEEVINRDHVQEIVDILNSDLTDLEIKEKLDDYHENDIATVIETLSEDERLKIYTILGIEKTAEVFSYLDDVEEFIEELEYDQAADIIEQLDVDDAIDILDELDEEDKEQIIKLMEEDAQKDISLIERYEEDMVGAHMTTNYIQIPYGSTVTEAMKLLVKEAADNDNVSTIYVVKENDEFYGSIELRDLIIARKDTNLDDIIKTSYPTLHTRAIISECINELMEYDLDLVPVINSEGKLVGVITSSDIIETVDEELTEDYNRLGGLSGDEEVDDSVFSTVGKRIPWLVGLLVLSVIVSMLTSTFEGVIAVLPAIVFFQSMVLGMSGNVGTQSLTVTIRVISDGINDKGILLKTIFKEVKVGFMNGLLLGILSFGLILGFLYLTNQPIVGTKSGFILTDGIKAAAIVGGALLVSMTLASFIGTTVPIILTKLKVDPAVASGPFITTINDIIAISIYYLLAFMLFSACF